MRWGKIMSKIVVGIDQSYKCTGITVLENKKILYIGHVSGKNMSHPEYRKRIREKLYDILYGIGYGKIKRCDVSIIFERIRLRSRRKKDGMNQDDTFLSLNYIQSTAALCGVIIDIACEFDIPVYSVDTRVWKSAIVGTSKQLDNKYGIDPKKYPTILYMREKGLLRHIIEIYEGRGTKGVITVKNGSERFKARVIDDIADSYCIALYGFSPEKKQKLKRENF